MNPWARRNQPLVSDDDRLLIERARQGGRLVAWWWGRARRSDGFWLRCHICGAEFYRWGSSKPLSPEARAAVMEHRAAHLAELSGAPSNEVPTT